MGLMRQFGNTITFSETPGGVAGPLPGVGQHTGELLALLDDAATPTRSSRRESSTCRTDRYGWSW